ncbi:hypothetical protein BU17DRAFT_43943, partial [Hysterangium stoloniferum]
AAPFNPRVHIQPIHANIKETQFDVAWFKTFDIVLNALDNLDARRCVRVFPSESFSSFSSPFRYDL